MTEKVVGQSVSVQVEGQTKSLQDAIDEGLISGETEPLLPQYHQPSGANHIVLNGELVGASEAVYIRDASSVLNVYIETEANCPDLVHISRIVIIARSGGAEFGARPGVTLTGFSQQIKAGVLIATRMSKDTWSVSQGTPAQTYRYMSDDSVPIYNARLTTGIDGSIKIPSVADLKYWRKLRISVKMVDFQRVTKFDTQSGRGVPLQFTYNGLIPEQAQVGIKSVFVGYGSSYGSSGANYGNNTSSLTYTTCTPETIVDVDYIEMEMRWRLVGDYYFYCVGSTKLFNANNIITGDFKRQVSFARKNANDPEYPVANGFAVFTGLRGVKFDVRVYHDKD